MIINSELRSWGQNLGPGMLKLVNIYSEMALLTRYKYSVSNINYVCVMVMKYVFGTQSYNRCMVFLWQCFTKDLEKDNSVLDSWQMEKYLSSLVVLSFTYAIKGSGHFYSICFHIHFAYPFLFSHLKFSGFSADVLHAVLWDVAPKQFINSFDPILRERFVE